MTLTNNITKAAFNSRKCIFLLNLVEILQLLGDRLRPPYLYLGFSLLTSLGRVSLVCEIFVQIAEDLAGPASPSYIERIFYYVWAVDVSDIFFLAYK